LSGGEAGVATVPARADGGPLRIGVISDTHIPEARAELWPQVFEAFGGLDAILHGGDIHDLAVLDQLEALAPVYSARGNGEEGGGGRAVAAPDPRVRETWRLDIGGIRVGIIHDLPVPEHPPYLTVARAMARRFGIDPAGPEALEVIVHGDTHVERIDLLGTVLCINPGSPTDPHNLDTQLGTLGFLEVLGHSVRASLCQLSAAGCAEVAARTVEFPAPARRAASAPSPDLPVPHPHADERKEPR
jgi:putative phosphoesterase